ncbi:MAG: ParB N-terminal domain-containing protein [Flavobacteriaceae bacterium]
MYSISFSKNLVKEIGLINSSSIFPHEKVISEKNKLLINYLESFNNSIIISSILCCSKSMVIIDGHHRFFALKSIGFEKIPVTFLNYFSDEIKTDKNNSISKNSIIKSGLEKNFLEPKSTNHLVFCNKTKIWQPVILLSSLFKLEK